MRKANGTQIEVLRIQALLKTFASQKATKWSFNLFLLVEIYFQSGAHLKVASQRHNIDSCDLHFPLWFRPNAAPIYLASHAIMAPYFFLDYHVKCGPITEPKSLGWSEGIKQNQFRTNGSPWCAPGMWKTDLVPMPFSKYLKQQQTMKSVRLLLLWNVVCKMRVFSHLYPSHI